jgi:putative transposase
MLVRSLVFHLKDPLPNDAKFLMEDFRLAVNNAIRIGVHSNTTSRFALTKLAYRDFRKEHPNMYSQHLVSAFEVTASILKNHRRRLRKKLPAQVPFVRRLFMKAENQAYKLDRENGILDLPIRAGLHIRLELVVSDYHRRYLDDESLSLGSLTLLPDRVIVAIRKHPPKLYAHESVVSLDTNERSLDGVLAKEGRITAVVKAEFFEVSVIQSVHHDRRKRLQKKKSHDRRTAKRLCAREGMREHHRIDYRMHEVANAVLSFAEERRSMIVLEDLSGIRPMMNRQLNRRISIWPRRKLHQIIEYKAAWRGIPVVKVDPRYSSRKCPVCGRIQDSRKGAEFVCGCGWHMDRHINASINLLQTAASKKAAGGLRFSPGAFQHDVVMVLCGPGKTVRPEPNGTSGIRAVA